MRQATNSGYRVLKEEVGMTRQFDVVVEQDSEGFFVATVPALPGCASQGDTIDELRQNLKEAIEGWLQTSDSQMKLQSNDQILEIAL
jgi:predicted RNase H-like HicB family nuclease